MQPPNPEVSDPFQEEKMAQWGRERAVKNPNGDCFYLAVGEGNGDFEGCDNRTVANNLRRLVGDHILENQREEQNRRASVQSDPGKAAQRKEQLHRADSSRRASLQSNPEKAGVRQEQLRRAEANRRVKQATDPEYRSVRVSQLKSAQDKLRTRLLGFLHTRMYQGRKHLGVRHFVPFGGVSVILVGDE